MHVHSSHHTITTKSHHSAVYSTHTRSLTHNISAAVINTYCSSCCCVKDWILTTTGMLSVPTCTTCSRLNKSPHRCQLIHTHTMKNEGLVSHTYHSPERRSSIQEICRICSCTLSYFARKISQGRGKIHFRTEWSCTHRALIRPTIER